jgi:hypothetical protein
MCIYVFYVPSLIVRSAHMYVFCFTVADPSLVSTLYWVRTPEIEWIGRSGVKRQHAQVVDVTQN